MAEAKTLRWQAENQRRAARFYPTLSDVYNATAQLLDEAAEEIENQRDEVGDEIIMSASELASYVEGYLLDLAVDAPDEAAKIFMHVFPTATILIENGTFIVDMDGKTS